MSQKSKKRKDTADVKELENKYKRAVADYRNFAKRYEEDKTKIVQFANEVIIEKFIDILEDLESAQKHIKDDGLNKVTDKFNRYLKEEGVEIIHPENGIFDPSQHEAIESVKGEKGKIQKVHRKGYKLQHKVIRPAIVSVGNGN